jgi:hypothetical protein
MIAEIITIVFEVDILLFCCGMPSITNWICDKF